MRVLGEDQDLGPGVLAAGADVVELSGVAEGDGAEDPALRLPSRAVAPKGKDRPG